MILAVEGARRKLGRHKLLSLNKSVLKVNEVAVSITAGRVGDDAEDWLKRNLHG
jgi:hypothetical protein